MAKPRPLGAKRSVANSGRKWNEAASPGKTSVIRAHDQVVLKPKTPFTGIRTRATAASKKPISAVRKASNDAFSQSMAAGKIEQAAKAEAKKPSLVAAVTAAYKEDYLKLVEQVRCSAPDLSIHSPVNKVVEEIVRLQAAATAKSIGLSDAPVFTHIPAKGPLVYLKPNNKLEHLQKLVGGYIEPVRVRGLQAWVNEEGRLMKLPLNHEATRLMNGFPIYGDMVVEGRV